MAKIRVVVADDHGVVRAGLRLLIQQQSDLEFVGEAADFPTLLRLTAATRPEVVTLDLTMPGGRGIPIIAQLNREFPQTRILVLTMHDDVGYLRAALAAGACGYVVKQATETELLSALRAVAQGRAFFLHTNSAAVGNALDLTQSPATNGGPTDHLSQREREVLELLAQGHTNQVTADRLYLSVKTVESYRARLMHKLNLASRADLVRFAIEAGLLGRAAFQGVGEPPKNPV
jgi:DNA-binding NarL/FixJ family response regulator